MRRKAVPPTLRMPAAPATSAGAVLRLGWRFHPPVDLSATRNPQRPTLGRTPRSRTWIGTIVVGGLLVAGCFLLARTAAHHHWTVIASTFTTTGWLLAAAVVLLTWWQYAAAGRQARRAVNNSTSGGGMATMPAHRPPRVPAERVAERHPTGWQPHSIDPQEHRLDIFGGDMRGWEALITVAGTSALSDGPLTVLDLTRHAASRGLLAASRANGYRTDLQLLPADLPETDLLTGTTTDQVIDILLDTIHDPGTSRPQRHIDERILRTVAAALPAPLSIADLAAAVRTLIGQPNPTDELTAAQRQVVTDELFTAAYLADAATTLAALDAHLHPLRHMATAHRPHVDARFIALATDGATGTDIYSRFALAAIMHTITTGAQPTRTLLLAGADLLDENQIQRLDDLCAHHHIRLILLWRRLRDTALRALGSGPAAFMRLGSHLEADAAAAYIGRQHTFVLSGQTRTTTASTVDTTGDTTAGGHSDGSGQTRTRRPGGMIGERWSTAETRTWTDTQTYSTATASSSGRGTSTAISRTRVYAYAVEPTFCKLPPTAVLLVEHRETGPRGLALDCNPSIGTPQAAETLGSPPRMQGRRQPVAPSQRPLRSLGPLAEPAALDDRDPTMIRPRRPE